jgi:hypothetical protein
MSLISILFSPFSSYSCRSFDLFIINYKELYHIDRYFLSISCKVDTFVSPDQPETFFNTPSIPDARTNIKIISVVDLLQKVLKLVIPTGPPVVQTAVYQIVAEGLHSLIY